MSTPTAAWLAWSLCALSLALTALSLLLLALNLSHPNTHIFGSWLDSTLSALRRLMHNRSDQEIRKVTQRPVEQGVEPLPERVGCQLGGQAGEQTAQRLRAVALQGEEVLQLRDHLLDDLPLARRPTPILFWPRPPGVVLRGGRHQSSVDLQPTPFPCQRGEALVRQVGVVAIFRKESIADGPLVAVGRSQPKGGDDALRVHHQSDLEAVDPLGFGAAASEGCLPGEEPLSACPYPHHRRDEGGVHDAVSCRGVGERLGHIALERPQLGRKGAHPPVELALGAEGREVGTQVRVSESPEVALAAEARPLGEYGERQHLALGEQRRTARLLAGSGRMALPPPVVHEHVQ